MAVAVDAAKIAVFEDIFRQPTIDRMLDLSWQDFEQFVAYVFSCAGYEVEYIADQKFPHGPGFDLNLYGGRMGGKPTARVEVRRYATSNLLDWNAVMAFEGKLQLAGGIPGFMVTTSGFNRAALKAAEESRSRAFLVSGNRLLRYITYVGGSRLAGHYAGASMMPADPIDPTILAFGEECSNQIAALPARARVLAVGNNKGGVAKTTTALNLGFALAEQYHQRVLLVDMDGQASLTRSLPRPLPQGARKDDPAPFDDAHLAHYFRGLKTLGNLIRPTRFSNLALIPSHAELTRLDTGSAAHPKAELQFVADLHALAVGPDRQQVYDWIILDTPPAQSFFTRLALGAADSILMPATAETWAVQGVDQVLTTARTMHVLTGELAHWQNRILGCLVTKWKPSKLANDSFATLRTELTTRSISVFNFAIPNDDKIEQAHKETGGGKVKHIFKLSKNPGVAAQAYDRLAKELLA